MKRLILICGLLASSFSFGADWVFVTETSDADEDYYVDKSYYKYNSKTVLRIRYTAPKPTAGSLSFSWR